MSCNSQATPVNASIPAKSPLTLDEYSTLVREWSLFKCVDSTLTIVQHYTFAVTGCVGLISYVLMLLSVFKCKRVLSGTSMIYHKATIFLEMIHMIVMLQFGVLDMQSAMFRGDRAWTIWSYMFQTGWRVGDGAKLAVSLLTMLISLERFVAVCAPFTYAKIDRDWLAYVGVTVAVLAGTAHLWDGFAVVVYFPSNGRMATLKTFLYGSRFLDFVNGFSSIARIVTCLLIFVFCCGTALGVRSRAKKVATLTKNSNQAGMKRDWLAMRRMCAFSYILGVCTVIDHVVWTVFKYMSYTDFNDVRTPIAAGESYAQIERGIWRAYTVSSLGIVQALTAQLTQGWRFWIYLVFNKTIRDGFRKVITRKGEMTESRLVA